MKGFTKVSNKKMKTGFFSGLIIVLISLLVLSSNRVWLKKTDNLVTNEGKAWDTTVIGFGIGPDDIIARSVHWASANATRQYAGGCIDLVNQIITNSAEKPGMQASCGTGYNNTADWGSNSTLNRKLLSDACYATTTKGLNGRTWWEAFGMNSSTLQPGDVIVGEGHAMIYLGQANSYAELRSKSGLTGLPDLTYRTITSASSEASYYWGGTYCIQYTTNSSGGNVGGTYWTIDVNGNNHTARISNYNWKVAQGESSNLRTMKLYRFRKNQPGSYNLQVGKVGSDNLNKYIKGATFKIEKLYNGAAPKITKEYTTVDNGYTTVESERTINSTGYDDYKINEVVAPDGYVLNSTQLGFRVVKELVNGKYQVKEVYYYSGAAGTSSYKEKTIPKDHTAYIFSDGTAKILGDELDRNDNTTKAKAMAFIAVSSDGSTISYVGIDQEKVGKYHLNVTKKAQTDNMDFADESNNIAGVTFTVKRYANKSADDLTAESLGNVTNTASKATAKRTSGDKTIVDVNGITGEHTITKDDNKKWDVYTVSETLDKTNSKYYKDINNILGKLRIAVLKENYKIRCVRIFTQNSEGEWVQGPNSTSSHHAHNGEYVTSSDTSPNEIGIYDLNGDGKSDIAINMNSDGTAFAINIVNPPLEGKYSMQIRKVEPDPSIDNFDLLDGFDGVVFKVNDENLAPTSSRGAFKGYTSVVTDKEITKADVGSTDQYYIEEIDLGENGGLVKLAEPIGIYVVKGVNSAGTAYTATAARFMRQPGVTASNNGTYVTQVFELEDGSTEVVGLKVENGMVTVAIPNTREGKYNLNIGKKSTDTYCPNFPNDGGTSDRDYISGATFEVVQYLNQDIINDKNPSYTGGTYPASVDRASTPVTFNNEADITINNITKPDCYVIKEIDCPTGYNKNEATYCLVVEKEKDADTRKYKIKNVRVYLKQDSETWYETSSVGTLGGESEDTVLWRAISDVYNDAYRVELNKATNTITFVVADQPIDGKYSFLLEKTDSKGRTITDGNARFAVYPYTTANGARNEVYLSGEAPLYNSDDERISFAELQDIRTVNGVANYLKDLKIKDDDIGKTYYFLIREVAAPSVYTKIDYDVVIPITFERDIYGYKATVDTANAFAIFGANPNRNGASGTRMSLETAKGSTVGVKVSQSGTSIRAKIPNTQSGSYNFKITKTDVSGQIIKDEHTRFDISVFDNSNLTGNEVQISNENGVINTKNLVATTGVVETLDGILITSEDIDKTYYFVVTETEAPDEFTKIDYEIVVPISFTEVNGQYKATKGEAYAVRRNTSGEVIETKTLSEVGTETTGVASTEQSDATINVNVPDVHKAGTYDFRIVKVDVSGNVIEDEEAKFNISVYDNRDCIGTEVTLSKLVDDGNGNLVETQIRPSELKGLRTITGVVEEVAKNIVIHTEEIGSTYYFRVHESKAPDSYTEINYDVVVPISFEERGSNYVAVKGEAYAITEDGEIKSLSEVATPTTGTVSTAQIDAAIVVNVPNTQISGKYSVKLLKVNESNNNPIANATFDIVGNPMSGVTRSDVATGDDGILDISNGDVTIVSDKEEVGNKITRVSDVDTYRITEKSIQSYLKLKYPLSLDVEKEEVDGEYTVSKLTIRQLFTGNVESIDVTDTVRSVTLNNVRLSDDESKVSVTVTIDDNNGITVKVPNKELEGKYKVSLAKVEKGTNIKLSGIPFSVNSQAKTTDNNGKIDVTEDDAGSDGYVKITKDTLASTTYTIEEGENENTADLAIIESPITLKVNKGENAGHTAYVVTSVDVTYTDNSGEHTVNITNSGSFYVKTKGSNVETKCSITVNSTGEIVLTAENTSKLGEYRFVITKSIKNEEGNYDSLPGVKFDVEDLAEGVTHYLETQEEGAHSVEGTTETITKGIDKINVNQVDTFIIDEVSSTQEDVVKLKNNIKLEVTKGLNNDGTKYGIKAVKLTEVSKNSNTQVISGPVEINPVVEGTGNILTLPAVELENGKTTDLRVIVGSNTSITMNVKNERPEGSYQVKVKKINSVTGQAISGIPFQSTGRYMGTMIYPVSDNTITGANGIGEFRERTIKSTRLEYYNIVEGELPEELVGKVEPITDFAFNVSVCPKLDKTTMKYIVDSSCVSMQVQQIATSATTERQRTIANQATLDVSDNTVTITIKNEPTVDYAFKIRKVNTEDEALKDAKFTIYEDDNIIVDNKSINDLINSGELESTQDYYWFNRKGKALNKTYSYKIYEMSPALGYDNILEKAYINVDINVDSDANITVSNPSHMPRLDIGGTSRDAVRAAQLIAQYLRAIGKSEIETSTSDNKTIVTLNIPNPRGDTPVKLELKKHTTGSENNGVTGAVFNTDKLVIENETEQTATIEIISRFEGNVESLPSMTTNAGNLTKSIDSEENAVVGNSYYYLISEDTMPSNAKAIYKKAIVRIHVNYDKTITADLIAAMPKNSDTWVMDASTINSSYLSLDTNGNTVTVNWANEVETAVILQKRGYKSSDITNNGGTFNIKNARAISGTTFTIKEVVNGVEQIVDSYDHAEISNTVAIRNTQNETGKQYHYIFEENASRQGYKNIFEGVRIHVYFTIDEEGSIDTSPSKTFCSLEGNLTAARRNFLSNKFLLEVTDNEVYLYVANEESTLNMQIKKISTTSTGGETTVIPGVEFGVLYNAHTDSKTVTTDEAGEAYIDEDISIIGRNGLDYEITERAVPDGVNMLTNVRITVDVDLTNAAGDVNNITNNDISVSVNATGAGGSDIINALDLNNTVTATINDGTITVTIPNESQSYKFTMVKTDMQGGVINSSDGNGAPKFRVKASSTSTSGDENRGVIFPVGYLYNGVFTDNAVAKPNTTYKYVITESAPKPGYINTLQGYNLNVYIETDSAGNVKDTTNGGLGGYTYYELEKAYPDATVAYTIQELVDGDYIDLSVNNNQVALYIRNPYSYKLQLNKKDGTGSVGVDKATILAEEISDARISDLHVASDNNNTETIEEILGEIVDSTSVSKELALNREATVTSESFEIEDNNSMMPVDGKAQLWRITETDVDAPYQNILEGKYLIVPTMYKNGRLNLVEHYIGVNGSPVSVPFYVCDEDGQELTADYRNYVSVETVKVDGEWTLSVTIKDPLKIKVRFTKVELAADDASEDSDFTPLSGATVSITNSSRGATYTIANGSTTTGYIDFENITYGNMEVFDIRETASAPGHSNILENKAIIVYVRTEPNDLISTGISAVDLTSGRTLSGGELSNVLQYVNVVKTEDREGYPVVNVYIENPVEYKVKLEKFDGAENPLYGTDIAISSTKSGDYSIGGNSNIQFTEDNLRVGEVVFYTIREYDTVPDSAYVNKFKDKAIKVGVRVHSSNSVGIIQAFMVDVNDGTQTTLSDIDGLSVEMKTDDDGTKILYIKMENQINIDINVQKRQYGSEGTIIPRTKFTLTNEKGEVLQNQYTDVNGNISFENVEILPGSYTYKVQEMSTAGDRYVNILENKYYLVNFTVDTDGEITINSTKIYNSSNDTEITANEYVRIAKYVDATVDTTNPIQKLNIVIYNPVKINFDLYKLDMENNAIENVEISARRFKLGNSNYDTSIDELTDDEGYVEVDNGYIDPGVYRYVIKEIATAGNQYINSIEGLKVVVYVKVFPDGTVKIADEDGNPFSGNGSLHYYVYDEDNNKVEDAQTLERVNTYFGVTVDDSTYHIVATLKNPIKYELDIIKKNSDGQDIGNSVEGYTKFSARRDIGVLVLDNVDITTNVELTEEHIRPGDHVYYITEDSTLPGYINKLDNKFIEARVNITGSGVLTVRGYDIYEGSINDIIHGTKLDRENNAELYDLISVTADDANRDGIYTLNVNVVNPDITYDIALNKKIFGDDEINLRNAKFSIVSEFSGVHELLTDRNGNIRSFTEKRVPAGTYRYFITEIRAPGSQFVNVFSNEDDTRTYVEVVLKVNEDGTIEIVDEQGNADDDRFYIYKQRFTDPNTLDPVDMDDTVVDEFVSVGKTTENKVQKLNFYVKDPEFYNFELIKKDKDTSQNMNNVEFSVTVLDENGNEVELRDAETLETLELDSLVTGRVQGVDGVILIPNILIEKSGKYTFILHEISTEDAAPILYKSWATDIRLRVEIEVVSGEYVITKDPEILSGEQYVDFTEISTTRAQFVNSEVLNERVKGSYDLIIDKLDSYTNNVLNGAEFDITVEKNTNSPVYNENKLYRFTDDVESMEELVPGHFTVNNTAIIDKIRIEQVETYTLILTETKAPDGYMLLDKPIKLRVTTGVTGEYDDMKFIIDSVELIDDENHGLVEVNYDEGSINVIAKNEYFDLALRKSITSVAYADKDDAKITEGETEDRVPVVDSNDLQAGTETTAEYKHVKNHVRVYAGQEVIYTLRVYNEGEIDGYAEEITDHLPDGLEFVNDDFNAERGWRLDESDEELRTIKTTYLSENNNPNNERFNKNANLIKKFDKETGVVDYKEIEVKCRVKKGVKAKTVLTNIAEISISKAADRTAETVDRDSTANNVDVPDSKEGMSNYKENELTDNRDDYVPGQEDDDDFEKLIVEEFDLALRKYIIAVNDKEVLNTSNDGAKYDREPRVNASALKSGSSTTAEYVHTKEPLEVCVGDIVTYTIEVFNEGTVSGYANLIKDDIPEGLEFVTYTKGDGSTNDTYRWKLVDANDKEVTDPAKAKYVVSDYLAKDNESEDGDNLLQAFDSENMDRPDSKYVQVAFKVVCKETYPKIITNEAQISDDTDDTGKAVTDRDSTTNEWLGEDDEDVEHIKVLYFDLALRKWVTKAIVTENGETNVVETGHHAEDDPEDVVKVDLKKSKVDSVVVKFEYQIRITNEGLIAGYADEVKDYIPEGLRFEQADNPTWTQLEENIVVTDELKNTLLQPGESAEVTIVLTWINSETNMGLKTNIAEISKDRNDRGAHDIDSTPNNKVTGEDDIDDAPVMLSIRTGAETTKYVVTALAVFVILGLGVTLVRSTRKEK